MSYVFYLFIWADEQRGSSTELAEHIPEHRNKFASNRLHLGPSDFHDDIRDRGIIADFGKHMDGVRHTDFDSFSWEMSTKTLERIIITIAENEREPDNEILREPRNKMLHILSKAWSYSRNNRKVFMCYDTWDIRDYI